MTPAAWIEFFTAEATKSFKLTPTQKEQVRNMFQACFLQGTDFEDGAKRREEKLKQIKDLLDSL